MARANEGIEFCQGKKIKRKILTLQLVVALKHISTELVREKAKSMGEVISKEDGLNAHVDGIISHLEGEQQPYIPKTK